MALNAYLTLTGETQGKVVGSCTQAGREEAMEIYGFNHEVLSPRDAASGLPTGKRQHKPVVITKAVDKIQGIWNDFHAETKVTSSGDFGAGVESHWNPLL